MASVLSIQIGRIAPLGPRGVSSAFVKSAVGGPLRATSVGLEGDEQADLNVHGGVDKAVYFYPSEHYPLWAADVPRHEPSLRPGAFGENVTTTGLDEQTVCIGDVFGIGSTQMQVTQPRQPCFKLGLRFADNSMGKIMTKTGRSGWYVRVLQPGELAAGDEIRLLQRSPAGWTISRFNQFMLHRSPSREDLMELSNLDGLPEEWRQSAREALIETGSNAPRA